MEKVAFGVQTSNISETAAGRATDAITAYIKMKSYEVLIIGAKMYNLK